MELQDRDCIVIDGNLEIPSEENYDVAVFVRIFPASRVKSDKINSFISAEPLLIHSSHSDLVNLIETQYNKLMNARHDSIEDIKVYKINLDTINNHEIEALNNGLEFDSETNIQSNINNIIKVSEESFSYAVCNKTRHDWCQVSDDSSLKSAIQNSGSQIFRSKLTVKERQSKKYYETMNARISEEKLNFDNIVYIILDLKVSFQLITKRKGGFISSSTGSRSKESKNDLGPPTKLTIIFGTNITKDADSQLSVSKSTPLFQFDMAIPKIKQIEGIVYELEDSEVSFNLDMFRTRLFVEFATNEKAQTLALNIGIKSPLFYRPRNKNLDVCDDNLISTTSKLFEIIYKLSRSTIEDGIVAASITLGFGNKCSDDYTILKSNMQYVHSLVHHHGIFQDQTLTGNALIQDFLSEGNDRNDLADTVHYYSQGASPSKRIRINDSASKVDAKADAVLSRKSSALASVVLSELYSNSHQSNQFYHGFSMQMSLQWAKYLSAGTGLHTLKSMGDSNGNSLRKFSEGYVRIPQGFLPFEFSMDPNDKWDSNDIWTSKISGAPYKPERDAFVPIDGKMPPHPKVAESSQSHNLLSIFSKFTDNFLASSNSNQNSSNSIDLPSSNNQKSHIFFTRMSTDNDSFTVIVDSGVCVNVRVEKTLFEHLREAAIKEPSLASPFEYEYEYCYSIPLKNSINGVKMKMEITKNDGLTLNIKEIINNSNLDLPIIINIQKKLKPRVNTETMFD
jgi:hypothetical protein